MKALLHRLRRLDREPLLLGAAALLLALALLNPTWPVERALFDHVVVLDVTQSMNVQDHRIDGEPVSRLEWARQTLQRSLLQLPCGSRVGWALFTEYRIYLLFTPVEVCANLKELRSTLSRIDGRMAWSGNSEVTKGLFSALRTLRQLPDTPALVFVTDGHEAPPLSPQNRPAFDGKAGEVPGVIVGVGGLQPQPIPKRDPLGRPLGWWSADEVMQHDPRAAGGAAGGGEHLSSLREAHLRQLAAETGLRYLRPDSPQALAAALTAPALARPVPARADLRPWLAAIVLVLLLARHVPLPGPPAPRR